MGAIRYVLLAAVLAGCAPAIGTLRTDVPDAPRLSRAAARAAVERGTADACRLHQCTARVGYTGVDVTMPDGRRIRLTFDRPLLEAKGDLIGYRIWAPAVIDGRRTAWALTIMEKEDTQRFVDAYGDLVAYYRGSTDDELYFRGQANAWRAANPKPALSPDAARHKVLAENAFREKDVAGAIEHYIAALDSDPAWPNGNFNLALLLAETGDFALAARHMRRYLLLVPDAKDAKSANEKVIVWEDKAARGG